MFGIAVGTSYLIPLHTAYEYFPHKKGLISGIIIGGFGLGAFIFGFIAFALTNPNDERVLTSGPHRGFFPLDVANRWPITVRWLSLIYFILMAIGATLVIPCPHEDRRKSDYG